MIPAQWNLGDHVQMLVTHRFGNGVGGGVDRNLKLLAPELGLLLLASWFGYSLHAFGLQQTFASNTTVAESQQLSTADNLVKIARNLLATFVPHPLLVSREQFNADFYQPNVLGRWRDWVFLIYQTNLTFAWGLFGWVAILWLWRKTRSTQTRSLRRFWILFFVVNAVIGVAVIGSPAPFGSAHICLQPLILVGVVFLACGFNALPPWMRAILLCALLVDATAGVMLQVRTQMYAISLEPTSTFSILPLTDNSLSQSAILNAVMPQQLQLSFWGDHISRFSPVLYGIVALLLMLPFLILIKGKSSRILICAAFLVTCGMLFRGKFETIKPSNGNSPSQLKYTSGFDAYHKGQLDRAAEDWVSALLLDPFDLRTRYALEVLLLTHGQLLENTDARFAEHVRLNPQDPRARSALAQQLRRRGLE